MWPQQVPQHGHVWTAGSASGAAPAEQQQQHPAGGAACTAWLLPSAGASARACLGSWLCWWPEQVHEHVHSCAVHSSTAVLTALAALRMFGKRIVVVAAAAPSQCNGDVAFR